MAAPATLQKILLLLAALCLISSTASAETVYEILPKYGLPSGLLPDSVTSYTFSEEDGSFTVNLAKACYVQFDYLVYYEKKITGKLSVGSITNLKGIQVQRFLFWFDVDEIKVDLPPSNSIYFQVGIINKKLDVDQFETVHSCRDNALDAICGGGAGGLVAKGQSSFRKVLLKVPTPIDDIQMLITE